MNPDPILIVENVTLDVSRWLDNVIANLPAWLSFLAYSTVVLA